AIVHPDVILHKVGVIPTIGVAGHRRILGYGAWKTKKEIGKAVAIGGLTSHGAFGEISIEGKDAIIVQQGLLDIFIEGDLGTELNRVTAAVPAEDIAQRVKIRTRYRPANSLAQSKRVWPAGDRELGQVRRALNGKCRTKSRQRGIQGQAQDASHIQATAEVAGIVGPDLVDHVVVHSQVWLRLASYWCQSKRCNA